MSLLDSLISYWKLNEASGNALDSHGSNTLTDVNGVSSQTGKIGNARNFERDSGQSFEADDNADFSQGSDDSFTFGVWVNAESINNYMGIVGKDDNGSNREYGCYVIGGTGVVRFYLQADMVGIEADTPLTTGNWFYLVFGYDGTLNELFISINGEPVATTSDSTGPTDGAADFTVGAIHPGLFRFDGLMDELGYWNRRLTNEEIAALYNSGSGLPYENFDEEEDVTPPTLSNIRTNSSGDTILADFSEDGCSPSSGSSGFSLDLTSAGITGWSISGTTLTISLSPSVQFGETPQLNYTSAGEIEDAAGNPLADFSGSGVSNNVADTTKPTVTLATVPAEGTTIIVGYAEDHSPPMNPSTGVTGYTVNASGGAVTVTGGTVDGDLSHVLTLSRTILEGETVTLSYSPGNVTDSAASPNALDAFTDTSVNNESVQTSSGGGRNKIIGYRVF